MSDFNNGWGANSGWNASQNDHQNETLSENHNDENNSWNNNLQENDELDDLLSETEEKDDSSVNENTIENGEDENNEEEEIVVIEYEDIKEDLVHPPQNVKNEVIFSERDAYAVMNVKTVLDMCSEKMIAWIDNALNLSVKDNARRAMAIVKLEHGEFQERVRSISTIKAIYEASIVKEGEDPFYKIIEAMKNLEEINEGQKGEMLSLLRKMIKTENVKGKRITTTRTSSDIDIVQDIRNVTSGEESIREQVVSLGSVIRTIGKIVY